MIPLLLLNIADVVTTRLAIEAGGFEANPLMQPFAHSWWQLAAVKAPALLVFWLLIRGVETRAPLYLSVFYAAVVFNNVTVIL